MRKQGIHQYRNIFEEKEKSKSCFRTKYLAPKLKFLVVWFNFKNTCDSFSELMVFFMSWILSI